MAKEHRLYAPHNFNIEHEEVLNKYVYRIFSLEKFLDIFARKSSQLTLVKPKLWEDPYENFLLNSKLIVNEKGTTRPFGSIKESLFGQCWTFNRESDFMWRVYAPNKDGIKVKVKLENLIKLIASHGNPENDDSCYIGKVEYQSWEEIKDFYESISYLSLMKKDGGGEAIIKTLLTKRKEFAAERELRIIYQCDTFNNAGVDFIQISLEPNKLFEEVVIDPRISTTRAQNSIEKLINKVGYIGKITHSKFYSFEPLVIKLR